MSVPGADSAQAAEQADQPGPAEPQEQATGSAPASPWDDPRLPWLGKPGTADILCWLGLVLSGVSYWALLPLRVSLVGTHPVIGELLNGGTESIISAGAFASTGHGTLVVAVLAAVPGLIKFDALYWWAGRLWGERFINLLPASQRVTKHLPRVQRAGRKLAWPAVVVSAFLLVPKVIVAVLAGWAGMRLTTFLILDAIGALLRIGLLVGLGYALGHHAVVAAAAISHYSLWVTIGIVALTIVFTVRSQRRIRAAAAGAAAPVTPATPAGLAE
jgi:membrane-associated protein